MASYLLRERLTKVVATVGPSLVKLLKEGVKEVFDRIDVFRFNFSHIRGEEDLEEVSQILQLIRSKKNDAFLLADLQGPKLRIGKLPEPITLKRGEEVIIKFAQESRDPKVIPIPHEEVFDSISQGTIIYLNDGKVRLRVLEVRGKEARAEVQVGEELSSYKGFNLPGTHLKISPITEKDRRDLQRIASLGFDGVALSFVQKGEDIVELRGLIEEIKRSQGINWNPLIIAKIETLHALKELENIATLSDGIMIARGDLAVEVSYDEVPLIQKRIIALSRRKCKPVIVATQVLSSMTNDPFPKRAELTDIANAILDGTDSIMLSEETAVGKYPLQVLEVLHRVARKVENYKFFRVEVSDYLISKNLSSYDAISQAVLNLYQELSKKNEVIIAIYTLKGKLFETIARVRPQGTILLFTPDKRLFLMGLLTWGTKPFKERFKSAWEFEIYLRTLKRGLSTEKTVKILGIYRDNHIFIV